MKRPAVLSAALLLCLAAAPAASAQVTPAPGPRSPLPLLDTTHPAAVVSISPFLAGPAVVSGEVDPHVGLAVSGGYNFLRRRAMSMGVDGRIGYGWNVLTGEGDADGTWTTLSLGFPFRFGASTSFFLRPALELDILDYYRWGYDEGDLWEREFDSSVGFGLNIGLGVDINIARRFALEISFMFVFLPVDHDGEKRWKGSYDGDLQGWFSLCGNLSFLVRI